MKFSIQREAVLQPLSQVVGVVERRQTLPVLANFLIVAGNGVLSVTGTDMEVELVAKISADVSQPGEILGRRSFRPRRLACRRTKTKGDSAETGQTDPDNARGRADI